MRRQYESKFVACGGKRSVDMSTLFMAKGPAVLPAGLGAVQR
jgi:hypothetical protein